MSAASTVVVQDPPSVSRLARLMQSSIGQKLVMAAAGVILSLFVLGHMTGNLLAFQGPGPIRKYAEGLRMFPAVLWAVRLGLLTAVGLHIMVVLGALAQELVGASFGLSRDRV